MTRPATKPAKVVVQGPLAPFTAEYTSRLRELGYTPLSIVNALRQLVHLSRWLVEEDLDPAQLTTHTVERFLALRAQSGPGAPSRLALSALLEVLRDQGVLLGAPAAGRETDADALLGEFEAYLRNERGLANETTSAYVSRARRFLEGCGGIAAVDSAAVTRSVQREAARVSVGSTQYFVAAVRAFLRFSVVMGHVEFDLSAAALAVTARRRSSLPQRISRPEALALLGSCDRRRSEGRRDYAVILVLLRLGLRANEVATLRLDDVDWRNGEVMIHGKGRREDRLPLPVDVGEAIAAYLRRGRPHIPRREIFLRSVAPIGPLTRVGVACVVRRACRRSGVAEVGPHRLRHSLACDMVGSGVELAVIGQVLRHSDLGSTSNYARVDVEALRALARPWPKGAQR